MESTILPTIPLLAFSKTLKFSPKPHHRHLLRHSKFLQSSPRCFKSFDPRRSRDLLLISLAGKLLRNSSSFAAPWRGLASISSSAGLSSSGGGHGSVGGGGGGGGGEGGGGSESLAVGSGEVLSREADVIILDVGGMSCGGCAASVKRILESQPQVSSASVNLATETAVVWAVPEANAAENWKHYLGEKLANHLTTCGFKSNLRDSARESLYEVFERKTDEKLQRLKESGRQLAVSWALCAVCLLGHASHFFGANVPSWIHAFHSTGFHLSLSVFTFIGPGRKLILDGLRSLFKGSPNMNSLVGLGAISSFAVSSIAALIPRLVYNNPCSENIY